MKALLQQYFELIFEMVVLVTVFIIGAVFLAYFPENERLGSWVTGGAIIGVLARALHRGNGNGATNHE